MCGAIVELFDEVGDLLAGQASPPTAPAQRIPV
jgi:hypothetical protein